MPRPRKVQGIEAVVDNVLAEVKQRLVSELSSAVQAGISAMLGTGQVPAAGNGRRGRGRGKRSAASRRKQSLAMKKAWAERKKKGKSSKVGAKAEATAV